MIEEIELYLFYIIILSVFIIPTLEKFVQNERKIKRLDYPIYINDPLSKHLKRLKIRCLNFKNSNN